MIELLEPLIKTLELLIIVDKPLMRHNNQVIEVLEPLIKLHEPLIETPELNGRAIDIAGDGKEHAGCCASNK